MSVNRYQPHLIVLPEDDANSEVAIGFNSSVAINRMQVLNPCGGWRHVIENFVRNEIPYMNRFLSRFLVLLIDFDNDADRLPFVRQHIPETLYERVFVLGTWSEPEELRQDFGTFEKIGEALAQDCERDSSSAWNHELLRHNSAEVSRMGRSVRPFLFN